MSAPASKAHTLTHTPITNVCVCFINIVFIAHIILKRLSRVSCAAFVPPENWVNRLHRGCTAEWCFLEFYKISEMKAELD